MHCAVIVCLCNNIKAKDIFVNVEALLWLVYSK